MTGSIRTFGGNTSISDTRGGDIMGKNSRIGLSSSIGSASGIISAGTDACLHEPLQLQA